MNPYVFTCSEHFTNWEHRCPVCRESQAMQEAVAAREDNARLRAVADAAREVLAPLDARYIDCVPGMVALRDALAALDPCVCAGDKLCMYHHRLKAEEKRGTLP